jgi:hypothetical protein
VTFNSWHFSGDWVFIGTLTESEFFCVTSKKYAVKNIRKQLREKWMDWHVISLVSRWFCSVFVNTIFKWMDISWCVRCSMAQWAVIQWWPKRRAPSETVITSDGGVCDRKWRQTEQWRVAVSELNASSRWRAINSWASVSWLYWNNLILIMKDWDECRTHWQYVTFMFISVHGIICANLQLVIRGIFQTRKCSNACVTIVLAFLSLFTMR